MIVGLLLVDLQVFHDCVWIDPILFRVQLSTTFSLLLSLPPPLSLLPPLLLFPLLLSIIPSLPVSSLPALSELGT